MRDNNSFHLAGSSVKTGQSWLKGLEYSIVHTLGDNGRSSVYRIKTRTVHNSEPKRIFGDPANKQVPHTTYW